MPINLVVAVTDYDWFRTLRERQPQPSEVNFWSPSGKDNLGSLEQGALFLFKLHAPRNKIVGGAYFRYSTILPPFFAWESFEENNGAETPEEFLEGLTKHGWKGPRTEIVCRVLLQPFFFDEADWMDPPPDWHPNIVTGKGYDSVKDQEIERALRGAFQERVAREAVREAATLVAEGRERYGAPQVVKPRLGQGGFRTIVADLYDRRCAVTRERTLPALEAAHIRPYRKDGEHEPSNGLLLRRDIHKLFDEGYVTVTPDYHFKVSGSIRWEFQNGREYYAYDGQEILIPESEIDRPDRDALEWHNTHVFKG